MKNPEQQRDKTTPKVSYLQSQQKTLPEVQKTQLEQPPKPIDSFYFLYQEIKNPDVFFQTWYLNTVQLLDRISELVQNKQQMEDFIFQCEVSANSYNYKHNYPRQYGWFKQLAEQLSQINIEEDVKKQDEESSSQSQQQSQQIQEIQSPQVQTQVQKKSPNTIDSNRHSQPQPKQPSNQCFFSFGTAFANNIKKVWKNLTISHHSNHSNLNSPQRSKNHKDDSDDEQQSLIKNVKGQS